MVTVHKISFQRNQTLRGLAAILLAQQKRNRGYDKSISFSHE